MSRIVRGLIVLGFILALVSAAVISGVPLAGPENSNRNEGNTGEPDVDGEYGEDETHLIEDPIGYKNGAPYWWEKDPGPMMSYHPIEIDCENDCEHIPREEYAYSTEKITNQIIERTNEFRQQEGLEKVTHLEVLDSHARGMAMDMHQRGYYGHDTPSGDMKSTLFQGNLGETACETYSENINSVSARFESFINDHPQADPMGPNNETAGNTLYSDWYESDSHRENMIRPEHDYIGVGIASPPDEPANWYIQMILCRDEPPELPITDSPSDSD